MNDPNGLHRKGDEWHLFYQYHPHSTQWGPMHWNHAVSKDLYHWRHYPVFLQPEQNLAALGATGGAFSGSASIDMQGQTHFGIPSVYRHTIYIAVIAKFRKWPCQWTVTTSLRQ